MILGTWMLLVYAAALAVLAARGHLVAFGIVAVVGLALLVLYGALCVSGDCAQQEEDHQGIRRS